MVIVDWVKHTLPMKLKDGKRHLFPTLASLVYRDDGKTTLIDEQGLLHADKADDSSMLGGKPPEAFSAVNLLDNSDFEIAQAGYGEMHGTTKFAADRWECHAGLVVSKVANGLEISSTREYDGMWQYLGIDVAKYSGKRMTAAMSVNGDVFAVTSTMGANQVNVVGNGATLILALAGTSPYVQVNVTRVATVINWIALYEGSYTADTLPPYVPKGYTAELAECRNFYKIVNAAVKPVFGEGTSTRVYAIEHGEMRATLNASSISIMSAIERIGWNDTGAAFSVTSVFPNNNTVLLYANGNVSADSGCWAMINLACSADL